ncbi:hypothetical protein [Vacuolonema iberomarrocanum]
MFQRDTLKRDFHSLYTLCGMGDRNTLTGNSGDDVLNGGGAIAIP